VAHRHKEVVVQVDASRQTAQIVALPEAEAATETVVATHLFQQEYLYAFAPAPEVAGYVRSQAAEEDRVRIDEIMASWSALQPRVRAVIEAEAGLPDTVGVYDVPDRHRELVAEFVADPLFGRTFQLPSEVRFVEIDKVIAYQRMVHLGYVGRLQDSVGPRPSDDEVLRLCVSPEREMDPIQHLAFGNAAHTFSSRNSDIRFLGAFLKRNLTAVDVGFAEGGGVPAAAIIAFVGYGTPMVNAFLVGRRVILNNGFHRVVALRQLGVERVPLVLQRVENPDLELPAELGGISRDYLIRHPRPALVNDFLEPGFTLKLRARERMRVVNLSVQVGQQDVPV
jgi:hypothetical protein